MAALSVKDATSADGSADTKGCVLTHFTMPSAGCSVVPLAD
jgi:hypothetical protein